MPKQQPCEVQWLDDAVEQDYKAAAHYLSLLDSQKNVDKTVTEMRAAQTIEFKAADLLRAAQLAIPKSDDRPTREQIKRIKNGERISPVLLMRVSGLKKVVIADGFHRVCAAFRLDPDVILHCKLVGT
ncbi:hypothetical protein ACI48D_16925 [Massilia sp. LXY-6]|uniref:hypothetical protein n=1 Tax=Massilia sp. LXY-6 TaxID=3379823 RepID=UPI003EE2AB8B